MEISNINTNYQPNQTADTVITNSNTSTPVEPTEEPAVSTENQIDILA